MKIGVESNAYGLLSNAEQVRRSLMSMHDRFTLTAFSQGVLSMTHDENQGEVQDDAAALEQAKGFIQRAIDMGHFDKETGAPLPEVYQLLKQALAAITCDRFAELCGEAKRSSIPPTPIEEVEGFEMNDACPLHRSGPFLFIFGPDEDEEESPVE